MNHEFHPAIIELGKRAREASRRLMPAAEGIKNAALQHLSENLMHHREDILTANAKDIDAAKERGIAATLIERLTLNEQRILSIAEGVKKVAALHDPVGEVEKMWKRPNGLIIGRKRVPLGVVGMIYESRPNVTVDAAALCIKSGNVVILRGGSEAIWSNLALVRVIRESLEEAGLPGDCVQLLEDTGREMAQQLMKLGTYIDVLIPRGGAGLIRSVVEHSSIPVIETGVGNCHVYVEKTADLKMAVNILQNSKVSRPSVCNAAESLLIDEDVAESFLPLIAREFQTSGVSALGCPQTLAIVSRCCPEMAHLFAPASEEDYYTEFLELKLSVKIVRGFDEAVAHIHQYGTKHSEAIVTSDYEKSLRFHEEVDAAVVYVNASTRFTDGEEFGFGAEIGISTQKLHARGPMGLHELTTTKYVVFGTGQIR